MAISEPEPVSQRRVYTWARTLQIAEISARRAVASDTGSFFESMNAMLYAAFTLEAFLNHLGSVRISFWPVIERSLRVKEKLEVLCDVMDFAPDFGSRPFQSMTEAFRLRDLIAHGKTEDLPVGTPHKFGTMKDLGVPMTEWESLCTPAKAARVVEDAREIVTRLHEAAGLGPPVFFILSESI
jgi:hypothetical protein